MRSEFALFVAAAVAPAAAQNNSRSIPPASQNLISSSNNAQLGVAFTLKDGTSLDIQPGQPVGKAVPSLKPNVTLGSQASTANGPLVVMMVDPDAPTPEAPTAGFFLHWMATDMMATTGQGGSLTNSTQNPVDYIPPGPPSTSSAHRYILYAFQQPADFKVPATVSNANRANFNVTSFVETAKLGTPVAANYMYVSAQTNVPPDFQTAPGGIFPGGNGNAIGMSGSMLQSNKPGAQTQ